MSHPNERPKERRGLFVVLEGGEGTGKTTQATILRDALRLSFPAREVVLTREPGATGAGHVIRQLLLSGNAGPISPRAELMMYLADRANHVDQVIRPALERDAIVVCDRYADSTIVYQGVGRGLGSCHVEQMSDFVTEGIKPDLVLVLDIDPVDGLARVHGRSGHVDRLEAEGLDFHRRIRDGFTHRVKYMQGQRRTDRDWDGVYPPTPWYFLVGADEDVPDVAARIWEYTLLLIEDRMPAEAAT